MARMDWFRLYTEARTDKKLATLTDAEHRVWFNLLCFAASQDVRGTITSDDPEILALECANGDTDVLSATLAKLQKLRIVAIAASTEEGEPALIHFIHFQERQYDKPSDEPGRVSERVKRHRENKGVTETPCNAMKRLVTPETPREEENRIEEKREEKNGTARRLFHADDDPPIDKDCYTFQLKQNGATDAEIAYAESELTRRHAEPRKWQTGYMLKIIHDLREKNSMAPPPVAYPEPDPHRFDAVEKIRRMAQEFGK